MIAKFQMDTHLLMSPKKDIYSKNLYNAVSWLAIKSQGAIS